MPKILFHLYSVPFTSYKSAMLCMLRLSRVYLLAVLYILPSYLIGYGYSKLRFRLKIWILFCQKMKWIGKAISNFHKTFCHVCLNKGFMLDKYVFVRHSIYPFGTALDMMVGLAWLCEKMKVNIEIEHPTCTIWQFFENNTLINTTDQSLGQRFEYSESNFPTGTVRYAMYSISSEYGHKVLSKLSIKESLKKSSNEWFDRHIKGDWVAVHYRGTDIEMKKNSQYKYRYRIELDSYITYLKSVLDEQSSIFACSDQAQFIDKMNEAFPGRVYARAIKRSYGNKELHVWGGAVGNLQQEIDALIDILILAKAELIYTTGSGFVDVVRYFNPQTKIVSLDSRRIGRGKNNMPIPRKDLFDRLSRPLLS